MSPLIWIYSVCPLVFNFRHYTVYIESFLKIHRHNFGALQVNKCYFQGKLSVEDIIIDTDIYQSDEGLPTLGQSTTDDSTLPLLYAADKWEEIRQRLNFTSMAESQESGKHISMKIFLLVLPHESHIEGIKYS